MGMFEECPLCPHDEDEFILAMWLHFTELGYQLDRVAPTEVARQFAAKEALVQQLKIMPDKCTHLLSMALAHTASCIPLLMRNGALTA
jgi:hypothetical protein